MLIALQLVAENRHEADGGTMVKRRLILCAAVFLTLAGAIAGAPAAEAVTVNHRSIGTNAGVLCSAGTATVLAGSVVVSFAGVALPAAIGRGDEIVIDDEELYILSRDSDTQLTLQIPADADHRGHAYAIRRAYTSIQAWQRDRKGNLVAEDRLEVGVCYDDGPFTSRSLWELARIQGSVTDAEHYMWLTAADGARHQGLAGAGVVLDGQGRTRYGILVADDYTRIEGLELKGFRRNFLAAAVAVWQARGVVLERLLIHDFEWPRFEGAGIEGAMHSEFTARNCIIYDGGAAGIITRWPRSSARVENCTVYGMRGIGVDESHGRISVVNTISMGNTRGDFRIRRGAQSHNISSDRSAAGEGSLVFLKPADQFLSITPSAEDFHLREDSAAVDAGKNLALQSVFLKASALPSSGRPQPAADIDGHDRTGEANWDIGADEVEAALEGVWFVDASLDGDGSSWRSAFGTIRQAIAAARPGEQIWVREGTYDLAEEILIDKPLALYGGFAGTERRLDQRDWKLRPSVLDSRGSSRCIHLSAGGTRIDGFVLTYAGGGDGGAVLARKVPGFAIENCRFEANSAINGGALYAGFSAGTVRNCAFADNVASRNGGAVYTESSALVIANCIFTGNSAGASGSIISGGGAVYAAWNGTVITNCSFYGNWTAFAQNQGGAVYNFIADTVIANSILWGNFAEVNPQLSNFASGAARTEHCNIDQAGFEGLNGNIRREPLWVNPALEKFRLQAGSPCIDAGTEDAAGLPEVDFDGNPRVSGATVDMGACEFGSD
jgi:hypothetical protein